MGYSNFKKIETLVKKFNLSARRQNLFKDVQGIEPSLWLKETLEMSKLVPLRNEKVKSERIVSPILLEVAKAFQQEITLFSGELLEVDAKEDLIGECDFFFTLTSQGVYLEAPIISIVEAKNEDLDYGIAQCAAQLYGARIFNEKEEKNIPILYGCTSTGTDWQFLRFEENTFYIDTQIYTNLREILGVLHHIIQGYIQK